MGRFLAYTFGAGCGTLTVVAVIAVVILGLKGLFNLFPTLSIAVDQITDNISIALTGQPPPKATGPLIQVVHPQPVTVLPVPPVPAQPVQLPPVVVQQPAAPPPAQQPAQPNGPLSCTAQTERRQPSGTWSVGGNQYEIINLWFPGEKERKLFLQPGQAIGLAQGGGSRYIYGPQCGQIVQGEYAGNPHPPVTVDQLRAENRLN